MKVSGQLRFLMRDGVATYRDEVTIDIFENEGEGLLFDLRHKIDVDREEAGCIEVGTLQISQDGLGCTLDLELGRTSNGSLVVEDIEFTADSYCPDFRDHNEGTYTMMVGASTVVTGIPSSIYMETGIESAICVQNLDFALQVSGEFWFARAGTEHSIALDLEFRGDILSTGSTSLNCDANG